MHLRHLAPFFLTLVGLSACNGGDESNESEEEWRGDRPILSSGNGGAMANLGGASARSSREFADTLAKNRERDDDRSPRHTRK